MNVHVSPQSSASTGLSAAPVIVALEGVNKTFAARQGGGAVTALVDISLSVAQGDIFGIIGRSGAGKSTLIRLINGLEKPSSGTVIVEGVAVSDLEERDLIAPRRRIGMVFQHFNLLTSRTVFGNVALPLEIAGLSKEEIRARVAPLLDLVGLSDKAERYPAELSGGQKQRVGIARALATRPAVLLCDEATSALDPETTASILALLKDVNRTLGVTIVLITHEIPVIAAICNRVAVMEAGRIVEQGAVEDVILRPQHATSESFVQSVTGLELPPALAQSLMPDPVAGGRTILRIVFSGENAEAPVLSRLTQVLGIDISLIAGRIGTLGEKPFGALLVSIPSQQTTVQAVLSSLSVLKLDGKVIGHVA